jgi:hypothetical protein
VKVVGAAANGSQSEGSQGSGSPLTVLTAYGKPPGISSCGPKACILSFYVKRSHNFLLAGWSGAAMMAFNVQPSSSRLG